MAIHQQLLLLSLCCLLAAALGASRQQLEQQQQAGPSASPSIGGTYCYMTVVKAPKVCAVEFIGAIFTGGNKNFIDDVCCGYLVCVHEASCVETLRKICSPKAMASKCEGFYPQQDVTRVSTAIAN